MTGDFASLTCNWHCTVGVGFLVLVLSSAKVVRNLYKYILWNIYRTCEGSVAARRMSQVMGVVDRQADRHVRAVTQEFDMTNG